MGIRHDSTYMRTANRNINVHVPFFVGKESAI